MSMGLSFYLILGGIFFLFLIFIIMVLFNINIYIIGLLYYRLMAVNGKLKCPKETVKPMLDGVFL